MPFRPMRTASDSAAPVRIGSSRRLAVVSLCQGENVEGVLRARVPIGLHARGVGSLGVVEPLEEVDRSPGVVADPSIVDALDGQWCEREVSLPAEPASRHQLGALEDAKVLEHGGAVASPSPAASPGP